MSEKIVGIKNVDFTPANGDPIKDFNLFVTETNGLTSYAAAIGRPIDIIYNKCGTGSKLYRMPFAGKVYSFKCIELASVVHFLQRVLKEQVSKYFIILQFDERHQYISFSLQKIKKRLLISPS